MQNLFENIDLLRDVIAQLRQLAEEAEGVPERMVSLIVAIESDFDAEEGSRYKGPLGLKALFDELQGACTSGGPQEFAQRVARDLLGSNKTRMTHRLM